MLPPKVSVMVDRLDWEKERKRQLRIKRMFGSNASHDLGGSRRANRQPRKQPSRTYYLRKLSVPERWQALKSFKAACDRLSESGDTNALYRWFDGLPAGRYRDEVIYPFIKERVGVGLVQRLKNAERHPRFKKFRRYQQLSSLSLAEYKELVRAAGCLLDLELD